MTKKHFIALADTMRRAEPQLGDTPFRAGERKQWESDVEWIANFCRAQSPTFNYDKWMAYVKR